MQDFYVLVVDTLFLFLATILFFCFLCIFWEFNIYRKLSSSGVKSFVKLQFGIPFQFSFNSLPPFLFRLFFLLSVVRSLRIFVMNDSHSFYSIFNWVDPLFMYPKKLSRVCLLFHEVISLLLVPKSFEIQLNRWLLLIKLKSTRSFSADNFLFILQINCWFSSMKHLLKSLHVVFCKAIQVSWIT